MNTAFLPGTFGYDIELIGSQHELVILKGENEQSVIAVSPAWQGRVMTSSLAGPEGKSLGWINHELIQSGRTEEHIHAYGGEDRFWLGPEGGQFSIYFKPGIQFTFENWFVPEEIDTKPFDIIDQSQSEVSFRKAMSLLNYSNIRFDLLVERKVKLLDPKGVSRVLGLETPGLDMVAYESVNTITNTGKNEWTKESGMLSIWILGMFQPSESTTVIIPFISGSDSDLGARVNDTYFGKIPDDRLKVAEDVLFFLADGKKRGKIGISTKRVQEFMGAYNEETNLLTIVNFTLDKENTDYVNSMWELQEDPFSGDVINSYNDGPLEDGSQMGPFFELESSSPAAGLAPGSSLTHVHRTIHITGDKAKLDSISQKVLGVTLAEVYAAF
ncbi:MAG: hypothetical protein ISS19_07455 [Bacteroidales bacterium]|nr:hypothetical protein [Bacteroidales bacterium]